MVDDIAFGIILGLVVGVMIGFVALGYTLAQGIYLYQETADDICINLTGNSSAIASSLNGKLICETPSYDSTNNIIVRKTGEDLKR